MQKKIKKYVLESRNSFNIKKFKIKILKLILIIIILFELIARRKLKKQYIKK
jgi:hypothetical protein